MTRKEKELLLKDLCGRFPYGVKVQYYFDEGCGTWRKETATLKGYNQKRTGIDGVEFILERTTPKGSYRTSYESWSIKPYLRPLSSMTEKEKKVYDKLRMNYYKLFSTESSSNLIDWLNSHHFDYRVDPETGKSMIDMELAIEAPGDMYKTE